MPFPEPERSFLLWMPTGKPVAGCLRTNILEPNPLMLAIPKVDNFGRDGIYSEPWCAPEEGGKPFAALYVVALGLLAIKSVR